MDEALQLFDELLEKNVVSWNAMILGHCIHGCPIDGLTLGAEMVGHGSSTKQGAKTTSKDKRLITAVTFVGLLGACVRPELMSEGQKYFQQVLPKYHISPKFAPFWGMANRYASLGLIQEVDCCRFLGLVDVVDRLANHLIELECTNTSHSPLLWSVSIVSGRWEDVFQEKEILEASNETRKQDEAPHFTTGPTSDASCVNILSTQFFPKWRVAADPWGHIIAALIVGNATSSQTLEWRVKELLKDRLQSWDLSKVQDCAGVTDSSLSKQEEGRIHLIAALGYEWALNPIFSYGVGINFHDSNGWTTLPWVRGCFHNAFVSDRATRMMVVRKDGTRNAGNSCQVGDGAGALLFMRSLVAEQKALPFLGVFSNFPAVGVEPSVMGIDQPVAISAMVKAPSEEVIPAFQVMVLHHLGVCYRKK